MPASTGDDDDDGGRNFSTVDNGVYDADDDGRYVLVGNHVVGLNVWNTGDGTYVVVGALVGVPVLSVGVFVDDGVVAGVLVASIIKSDSLSVASLIPSLSLSPPILELSAVVHVVSPQPILVHSLPQKFISENHLHDFVAAAPAVS